MLLEIPDESVRALEAMVPADQVETVLRRVLAVGLYKWTDLPREKAARLERRMNQGSKQWRLHGLSKDQKNGKIQVPPR